MKTQDLIENYRRYQDIAFNSSYRSGVRNCVYHTLSAGSFIFSLGNFLKSEPDFVYGTIFAVLSGLFQVNRSYEKRVVKDNLKHLKNSIELAGRAIEIKEQITKSFDELIEKINKIRLSPKPAFIKSHLCSIEDIVGSFDSSLYTSKKGINFYY